MPTVKKVTLQAERRPSFQALRRASGLTSRQVAEATGSVGVVACREKAGESEFDELDVTTT